MTHSATPFLAADAATLRAILDHIPARVALFDANHRHRFVNRDYAAFFRQPAEAIVGQTIVELVGAQANPGIPYAERALAGETSRWDGWMHYGDARGSRFLHRFFTPNRDETGTIDGYVVLVRDLTELKQSEETLALRLDQLRASEALNTAVIASALDCVVVIDEAGEVVEFNPAAEIVFGISRADALGKPIGDLIVPPALRERHALGFARYLRTGEANVLGRRIEIDAMRADGTSFPVELSITEVRLTDRRLFTAHIRDLTSARAAEAEIQRHREALHQSEKMAAFGSLLAGVAHELNNPLSIVIGNALMLREQTEILGQSELHDRAGKVQLAAERCARIVRSFLAMARQRKTQPRAVSVVGLVGDVLALLAYGLRSDGIEVTRDLPDDLPDLFGDADQLHQIIANLLANARQALERQPQPRRIDITARQDDDQVTLSIADNGPGVPAAIRGRIFDPFFTTKPMGSGTGIGLAVSRGIAVAHGGTIDLDPDTTGGARFTLRVPVAPPDAETRESMALVAPAAPRTRQRRALVVDDEADVAEVLAHMLSARGFVSDIASTGAAAQDLLTTRDYDVILCDVRMPDIGGLALHDWLVRTRPHLRARLAFITGDTLGQTGGTDLSRTGRPILEKPFLPDELHQVIAAIAPSDIN